MTKGRPDQQLYTFPPARVPVGERLCPALQQLLPSLTSRQAIYAISNGMVKIDDRVVRNLDHGVPPGCTITLDLRHGVRGEGKPDRPPLIEQMRVVHDESAFVVVVKGTGVIVQPSQDEERGRHGPPLVELLKHYWKARREGTVNPILVQRLDKETSGLMVLAKTIPASRILQRQAGGREMERRYVAIVEGNVEEDSGTWQSWMGTDDDGMRCSVAGPDEDPPMQAREAITHFKVAQRVPGATLLELRLGTGRTHQIRIHCAEAGHPVVGDFVYVKLAAKRYPRRTFGELPRGGRMMLHATRLKFRHPGDNEKYLTFDEPAPEAFENYLKGLVENPPQLPAERPPRRWEDRAPAKSHEAPAFKSRDAKPAGKFAKAPRKDAKPFAKREGGEARPSFGKKPFAKKPFDKKAPYPKRDAGDGEKKTFGKKPFAKKAPFPKRDAEGGEEKSFGKKPFAKKPFDKKSPFPKRGAGSRDAEGGEQKSFGKKPFAKKPFDKKSPFPKRGAGSRDAEGGEKKSFGKKPFAKKPFDKGPRVEGDKPSFPKREFRRDDKPRDGESAGGKKPFAKKSFGPRKFDGDGGEKKPFGKKPFAKKSFDKPASSEGAPAKRNFGKPRGPASKPSAPKPSPWGAAPKKPKMR